MFPNNLIDFSNIHLLGFYNNGFLPSPHPHSPAPRKRKCPEVSAQAELPLPTGVSLLGLGPRGTAVSQISGLPTPSSFKCVFALFYGTRWSDACPSRPDTTLRASNGAEQHTPPTVPSADAHGSLWSCVLPDWGTEGCLPHHPAPKRIAFIRCINLFT